MSRARQAMSETGIRAVMEVCQMIPKELAYELGISEQSMRGILRRNATLKDDPYSSGGPNFRLIREFGIDPDSCREGVWPRTFIGEYFSADWRDIWKVSDPGSFTDPCDQLITKYFWTLDWFYFGGQWPIRANDETKGICDYLGLSPDNLLERGNAPLGVLTHVKKEYFWWLSHTYLRDVSLSGRKGSNPKEIEREHKRSQERDKFYKNMRNHPWLLLPARRRPDPSADWP